MSVLSELEPADVFYYFEEISRIPHGSYHEKEISDYLVHFAKEHDLEVWQDELYNVVMKVPATMGREKEEPLILQGHMDMVCEKKAGTAIDMEQEGLSLYVDEDYICAKDTTLGGDDGIALAYMLAIATDEGLSHPLLEYIITVSEEVGMEGASEIDLSMLKGKCMLNLDSEEEGIFLTSCAGGIATISTLPVAWAKSPELLWYELSVTGLVGGHSGCEIDKGRANANRVLGRVLYEMKKQIPFSIHAMEGGKKDNVIPIVAKVILGLEERDISEAECIIAELEAVLRAEYAKSDASITLEWKQYMEEAESDNRQSRLVLDYESLEKVLTLLMALPDGVQGMSMSVPGLVETSLNLGIMRLEQEHLFLQHSIRSSVATRKEEVASRVESLVCALGGSLERKGDYPAWEYKEESEIRPRLIALYEKMYGKKPVVEGIHAGLECGLLAGKLKGLDCVSMGPDILDIHTTEERLSISSTKRVYEFLKAFLEQKQGAL